MGKEMPKIRKTKEYYNVMLGKVTHLIIYNPTKAIKKRTYQETVYYYFEAKVISKDKKLLPTKRHSIQLPAKTLYFQLYHLLETRKLLDIDKVCLTITKHNNYNYDIVIHPTI